MTELQQAVAGVPQIQQAVAELQQTVAGIPQIQQTVAGLQQTVANVRFFPLLSSPFLSFLFPHPSFPPQTEIRRRNKYRYKSFLGQRMQPVQLEWPLPAPPVPQVLPSVDQLLTLTHEQVTNLLVHYGINAEIGNPIHQRRMRLLEHFGVYF